MHLVKAEFFLSPSNTAELHKNVKKSRTFIRNEAITKLILRTKCIKHDKY